MKFGINGKENLKNHSNRWTLNNALLSNNGSLKKVRIETLIVVHGTKGMYLKGLTNLSKSKAQL
jgi:hypothetical protein